jgi:hypothetical protein
VTGIWEWDNPGEKERTVMKLSQQFQIVSGTLRLGSDEVPVKNLELRGDRLQFVAERFSKGQMKTVRFIGRVQGHLIEGTAEEMTVGSHVKKDWRAKRDPSSMKPLDLE